MNKSIKTGWPAIGTLIVILSCAFIGWLCASGDSLNNFYEQRKLFLWAAGALVGFCVLSELARLKCPHCRSRDIELLSSHEVDRWIGQKVVNENTVTVGAFQTSGNPKRRGRTESISTRRRVISVTKRRLQKVHRCQTCEQTFERQVVEEMQ